MPEGAEVRAVDRAPVEKWFQLHPGAEDLVLDLSDPGASHRAVAGSGSVYNLAAEVGGMGFIQSSRALCMLSVLINTHMLEAAREAGVERYFYASSACVYPVERQESAEGLALAEDDAYPASPEDGYGWEKLFGERMCRHFSEDFGLRTRVARYHNVYGSHGTYEGGREKAPAAICRKVAEAKLLGADSIEIWGDGEQKRSFTYVDDCVEGTLRLMSSECEGPVNLGSSEMVSINQLADLVEEIAGVRLERRYDLGAPQGVRGRNSDNTRIRAELGWEPTTPLRDGIEGTYRWVHDQLASGRPAPAPAI